MAAALARSRLEVRALQAGLAHGSPSPSPSVFRTLLSSTVIARNPAVAARVPTASAASESSIRTVVSDLLKLSKHRLSALVAFTATTGYMCRAERQSNPTTVPHDLPSDPHARSDPQSECSNSHVFSVRTLTATTVGTFLTAASANTLNQVYERFSDALMARTARRPLPSGRVGLMSALAFAGASALAGLSLLYHETNTTATLLAASNIALYAGVYTPLKRFSPVNTWVGAVVGAIPPLLGWAAASEGYLLNRQERPAWLLASFLFLWQIPHFHALAVALRADYVRAGLRMLGVSNPIANARWAAITAALLVPTGFALHAEGVVNEAFAWQSALLSVLMYSSATSLVANPTSMIAARSLFRASIVHLPVSLVLLLAQRNPYPSTDQSSQEISQLPREVRVYQPWEVYAPFPFLPIPRGAPAVVFDLNDDAINRRPCNAHS